jgi:hypothetical protein
MLCRDRGVWRRNAEACDAAGGNFTADANDNWTCVNPRRPAGAAEQQLGTIPQGLPDDLVCKSSEPYSPCIAASVAAAELWVYALQYRSTCAKEPTYPDVVDCLSRHLWGLPFGFRKHYSPPRP